MTNASNHNPALLLRAERLNEDLAMHGRPDDLLALVELVPEIEAMMKSLSGEAFARSALTLMKPLAHMGRMGELAAIFNQALNHAGRSQTNTWLRVRLAELEIAAGEPEQALRILDAIPAELRAVVPAQYYARCLALRELQRFDESIIAVESAMRSAEESGNNRLRVLLLNVRGGIEVRRQHPAQAIPFF